MPKLTNGVKAIESKEALSTEDSSPKVGRLSEEPTTRQLSGNWLSAYAEYTSESESPEDFHLWNGLSTIASAVRRNVSLDQGFYTLYPHLFVILVGPPGIVGKTTTINMGRKILRAVEDINFGPDSVTREELIKQVGRLGDKTGSAAMTIHSKELSDLISPSKEAMIAFLTSIYDGDDIWKYATKGSGKDDLVEPVINLMAATTPSWISEGLPSDIIGHGFIARVIFVYAEKPRYLKPFPKKPDQKIVDKLKNDIIHISNLNGKFEWGRGSKRLYATMYRTLAGTVPNDYRLVGFHNRKKIHILKIAMLLAIAESDDLTLTERDLEAAWKLLLNVEKDMSRAFSAVGGHEHASNIERILARITLEGSMTQAEIYNEFFAMGGDQEIRGMLLMLIKMDKITHKIDEKSGTIIYSPSVG